MRKSKEFNTNLISLQDIMLNLALRFTANKNDAKDLLQETNLRALNKRDKFIDNRNFKGWVLTIMRNIFLNNYRRKVISRSIIDQTDNLYNLSIPHNSGLDTPDGAFDYLDIKNRLNNLDDGIKTPFSMYLDGYKYVEIAKGMGAPLGTIKSRIFLARKKLKIILIDYRK